MKNDNLRNESFDDVCTFIIELGEQLHGYGPNAYRLEMYLGRAIKALGYFGVFNSTPNEIRFAFSETQDSWQKNHISKMSGTGIELNRLAKVGELVDDLEAGKLSLKKAYQKLSNINEIPHPWGNISNGISYIMAGASFPVLLGGGWWDVILSGVFSLIVFFMVLKSSAKGPLGSEWLPFSTAFVIGVLTTICRYFLPEINVTLIIMSAVLILIPGYGISVGVVEIVSKHISSGLSNLVTGLVYLFKQFFGAWLGFKLVGIFLTFPEAKSIQFIDSQWLWIFMPLLMFSLVIAFQTPKRDAIWAFLGMVITYVGIVVGSNLAGANFGNLLGTILAVVFANTWGLKTGRPSSIILLPAFVLLVSGSIGFRGLAAFATGNAETGEHEFIQMFIVALTLAVGLVIGFTFSNSEKQL